MLTDGSNSSGRGEHPGIPDPAPSMPFHPSRRGWKILLGSKTPIFGASPTPKPGVSGNCHNPVEDKAALCVLLSPKRCLSPFPVPVCSKLAGFCPNPAPGPRPAAARNAGKDPAAPRKNQAGRNRRKQCPASDATSPRVPMSPSRGGRGSLGGVAQLGGGVPRYPAPPVLLWVRGLGSETSRVGWMCSSQLHPRGSCGVWGGRRGPGASASCPPPCRGSCHQVWDSSL